MPGSWRIGRRSACTAAATACATTGIAILALTAITDQQPPPRPPDSTRGSVNNVPQPERSQGSVMPRSKPVSITVPKIHLKTAVETVATARDGSVAMPTDPDHAAWFNGSSTPGENGNSIVVGHLDSRTGPAAFYGLGALRKGDEITVERRDGNDAVFALTRMEVYSKEAFPSDRVYRTTPSPQLTLITCADWDKEKRDYRANLVITARPVSHSGTQDHPG